MHKRRSRNCRLAKKDGDLSSDVEKQRSSKEKKEQRAKKAKRGTKAPVDKNASTGPSSPDVSKGGADSRQACVPTVSVLYCISRV